MRQESQPRQPPPFNQVWFNEAGIFITDMISYILGFKTNEYIDEIVLVLMSIFTQGQPLQSNMIMPPS